MQKSNILNKSNMDNNKAIIFIHGWKGNKNSFVSLSSMLKIKNAQWFFPEAPYIIDNNTKLRSWSFQKEDGTYEIKKSRILLENFLFNNILNKFLPKNVFFIGFSQGATVCYEFLLRLKYSWGGVFPVAGFIRDWSKKIDIHPNQKKTMIYIGHGITDEVINVSQSEKIYEYLSKNDFNCKLMKYNGGHKISLNYLREVEKYINK